MSCIQFRNELMTIMEKKDLSESTIDKMMDIVIAAEDKEQKAKELIEQIQDKSETEIKEMFGIQ